MLTPFFHPHIGGVETHVKEVSEILVKKGHNVKILTLKHEENLLDEETINGVKIFRFPKASRIKVISWIYKNKNLLQDVDILHCHDFATFTSRYLPFRFLFPKKPVFITFHGFEGKIPIPKKILFLRRICEWLTKGNICVGDFIPKWYGTKTDFITYGGVEKPLQIQTENNDSDTNNSIVFVGRLEKDTGIMTYINSIKILSQKYGINLKMDVCGDGSLQSIIKKFIEKNNLDIKLHGFVDPSQFFIRSKFAFVSGYLAILQAMINKKIVFGVYENELKKDYLMLMPNSENVMVIVSSAEELAEQLSYHLKNSQIMKDKVEASYNFAKNQTWEKVANMYLDLWNRDNN